VTVPDPYDTKATVADPEVYFRRWREMSDDVRAHTLHARDLRFGPSADETLDLVVPHTGAPLLVWFHGGYWRRFHKDDNTFVARGLAPHGIATAIVNYSLAPAVPLEEIVAQARRAVAWLRENARWHGADPSRIVVAGHSAGGHLAAMCAVEAPVGGVVTLSGLHDLRPVLPYANDWLQLDQTRAEALSPFLLAPAAPTTVIARAGERETYAFKDQAADFAEAWRARDCETSSGVTEGDNHFTIIERLADPNDPLTVHTADLALTGGRRRARAHA
jgi:arylformamidase